MKKGIAIGMLVAATFVLMGCQQKPAATSPGTQQQTSTATIKITAGQETTSVGTLDIKPGTEQTSATGGTKVMKDSTTEVTPNKY